MWWKVGVATNLVIAVAYFAIAAVILRSLTRTGQLRENRLALATAAIFLFCAGHFGLRVTHLLLPSVDAAVREGTAMRHAWDWQLGLVDILCAVVAVYYWTLRTAYEPLMRGAKLFEDLKENRRQALEINDNIVQGLTVAHMALELDEKEQSQEALERTLIAARKIITDLLGDVRETGAPLPLRTAPATISGDPA